MLIEKKTVLTPGDIVVVKPVTGEEVTGKLVALDDKTLTMARPIRLLLQNMGGGQGAVGFAPFMLGLDDQGKVTFPLDKLVVMPIKARADLAGQYTKATTGIEVPSKPLVV